MTTTLAADTERLGDVLIREGLLTRAKCDQALAEQRSSGHRLGYVLVKLGLVAEVEITKILARQHRMPAVDLSRFEVDPKILKLIPADLANKQVVLPLKREGRTLTVAMADPTNMGVVEDLKFITRYDLFPVLAGEYTLRSIIERHYQQGNDQQLQDILKDMEGQGEDVEIVAEMEDEAATQAQIDDAPVVKLINGLLTDAVRRGASDIHIEPFEHELRVRYRIDGALLEVMKPPLKMKAALTSRIKILSQLNIAERRVPQDGRLKLKMGNRVIDFRVSMLPVLFGEKIVLRILDKGNLTLDLSKFGFEKKAEDDLMAAILNPYGMVLVTGPTGSGKTTTLYSALSRINTIGIEHHDGRGPGRVQPDGDQPGPGAQRDRPDVRRGAEGVPAPGPQHHHDRRNPGPGDGQHRDQGRPHGPPGALDAAHQRRAEHHHPHDRHGHRGVQRGERGQPRRGAAAGAAGLQGVRGAGHVQARGDQVPRPDARAGQEDARSGRGRGATPAAAPATRAARGSTR